MPSGKVRPFGGPWMRRVRLLNTPWAHWKSHPFALREKRLRIWQSSLLIERCKLWRLSKLTVFHSRGKISMPNPRKPFRINVGFIIHEETGYSHEIPFELDKVKLEDLELKQFEGAINIGRTPQGLIIQG